jgi:hypothetical protein
MVGNFPLALPASKIGGAPHEELQKRWSGADFGWSGAELLCLGIVFGVESNIW